MKKIICPDCNCLITPVKDYCHIHRDNYDQAVCGDYAWICPECETLNVDYMVRS